MSILITGGTGFIGSNMMRLLVEQGRDAIAYDAFPPPAFEGTVLGDMKGKFKVESGSVTDLPRVLDVVRRHKVEGIIHTAAILPTESPERPMETLQVNVIGTGNVLEAARIAGLRRVVMMSTSISLLPSDDLNTPQKEELIKIPPEGIYSLSRITMEYLAYVYRTFYSVDAIAVRPRYVYGPSSRKARYTHIGPIWQLVIDAVDRKPIIQETGGDTLCDFTYAKDVAKGVIQAFDWVGDLHYVYNLSYGQNRKVSEVCNILRDIFPDLTIEVGPGKWKRTLFRGEGQEEFTRDKIAELPPMDITRARNDFGYAPEWNIERAVPDWVRWLKEGKY